MNHDATLRRLRRAEPTTSPAREPAPVGTLEEEREDDQWATVVWNDPVNLMSYVVYVFRSYFGFPRARAEELMRQVHEEGRATVSRGSREQVETDVHAMHGYGLHASMERQGSR